MTKNTQTLAKLLGAEIAGQVPDVGGGEFGAARLANVLSERLQPSSGERAGRPSVCTWTRRPKVPMSEATERKLARIAAKASSGSRKVSPMQVAAQLLEEVVARMPDE